MDEEELKQRYMYSGAEEMDTIYKVMLGYEMVEQAIRNHVSNMLMDTDEQHPASICVFVTADPKGWDQVEFDQAYMMPGDGRIYFHMEGETDNDEAWHDFSKFSLEDQLHILKQMYGI